MTKKRFSFSQGRWLKKKIEADVQKAREKYGNTWVYEFFNNFTGHLPGGFFRMYRADFKDWDKSFSKALRKQSLGEFYNTIDTLIEEEGINPRDILEIQKRKIKSRNPEREYEKLCELTLPVYIRLREMGYKHYPDLTA